MAGDRQIGHSSPLANCPLRRAATLVYPLAQSTYVYINFDGIISPPKKRKPWFPI